MGNITMCAHHTASSPSNKKNARRSNSRNKTNATGQVRIIGGRFKRQWVPFIDAPGLRPSPDRLRETLFNWMQFELNDANVLDLCAGSGVIGFESLSRGARHVTFIERQPEQANLIQATAQKLRLSSDSYKLLIGDATQLIPNYLWPLTTLEKVATNKKTFERQSNETVIPADQSINSTSPKNSMTPNKFHFVILDPPYDLKLWVPLLNQLIEQNLINNQTLLYIEDRRDIEQTLNDFNYRYEVIKHTKVGQIEANLILIDL